MNSAKSSSLSTRDRAVLEHVARNRLTTTRAASRAALRNCSRNAAAKVLRRLHDAGYLQRHVLVHPTPYFILTRRAARLLGAPVHLTLPLGPQSLPTEFAVLAFATFGRRIHQRLRPHELMQRYPWLPRPLAAAPHCLDPKDATLELIRVDLGGTADHLARKCQAALDARLRVRQFASFLSPTSFRLVVITATRAKAAAIRRCLQRRYWPHQVAIHLSVVPQLLPLLSSDRHA